MNLCWQCIKGRHSICEEVDEDGPCKCPVPHDGSRRKPLWDGKVYVDPGLDYEPEAE